MADDDFGELRSLLHGDLNSRRARETLLALVLRHEREAPDTFAERWLPYLEGQRIAHQGPFGTVTSLDDVERLAQLLPGATFRLSLGHIKQEDFDVMELASDPRLRHISAFVFDGLAIDTGDLELIIQNPHLEEVHELDLGDSEISSLQPLFDSPKTKPLRVLDLQRNPGADFELGKLAQHLPNLRILDLSGCYLSEDWARQQLAGLENLEHLYLD